MKRSRIIVFFIFILIVIVISIVNSFFHSKSEEPIYLEMDYYGLDEMTEVSINKLNDLIHKKKSFAVFIYQPMCVTSANFESVLNDFLENKKISIYKISFSSIKNTEIGKIIKYYPSFIIYHEGKMMDFLEANKDEDIEFYTSEEGFEKWFTKYVKLLDTSSNKDYSSNN